VNTWLDDYNSFVEWTTYRVSDNFKKLLSLTEPHCVDREGCAPLEADEHVACSVFQDISFKISSFSNEEARRLSLVWLTHWAV